MRLPFVGPGQVVRGVEHATGVLRGAVSGATELPGRVEALLARVESLLGRVEALMSRIEAVAGAAEQAASRTHAVVDSADGAVARADGMLTQFEQPLAALLPSLRRFADTVDPHEVEAAVALIDRLPDLLGHVEDDLLPMLRTLDRVGPDVHEILEVVEDLRRVIAGLPGVGLLRRRTDSEPPRVESTHEDGRGSR